MRYVPYKMSYAFTLQEMLEACTGGRPYTTSYKALKDLNLGDFDKTKSPLWVAGSSDFKTYVNDLFMKLCSYYLKEYVIVSEEEDLTNDDKYTFFRSLFIIMELTYDRYSTLLKAYSDSASDLLAGLKSEGYNTSRFNDTPQSADSDFPYEDMEHVSNVRKDKNTIESDNESRISRLNELRSKIANLYKDWLKEFSGLFMSEGSLNLL